MYKRQVSLILPEKNPSRARSNPTILIKKDEDYKKVFYTIKNFQTYLNAVMIFKSVEKEMKAIMSDEEFKNDALLESITKIFKFHVSRILISELTKKGNPQENELKNENITKNIDKKQIKKSIFMLKEIIQNYKENNPQSIDNISKQSEFSNYITEKMNEKYKEK